jgi:gamma-glutamyltranspeptidase/glutathione hydrolase
MARRGQRRIAFGSMGGDGQPQIQAQVLLQLVDAGLDAQSAVDAPRLRIADDTTTWVEASHPHAATWLRSIAGAMPLPPLDDRFGHAHVIVEDGPQRWDAGADRRSDGSVERA